MDPLTVITGALAAGASAAGKDIAAQGIKDAYAGLKRKLIERFGQKAEVQSAIEQVEKKPDSEPRQTVLAEELEVAGAHEDSTLIRDAQALLDLLKDRGLLSDAAYQATLTGSGAIAQGWGAVAAGAGGVAVGGGVWLRPSEPLPGPPRRSGRPEE
jgi:hypothetical protein